MTTLERLEYSLRTNNRHPICAYKFLHDSLCWASKRIAQKQGVRVGHITAKELSLGFRDLAIREFGCMALTVIESWKIHSTRNIGEMVFELVGKGIMGLSNSDRESDFIGLYEFSNAFHIRPVVDGYDAEMNKWTIRYVADNSPKQL
ncbi:MAG: hypothetical protein US74_C0012G0032 [Parcubacteria group bacterium GW2011_GWA2_38_13]|nr:MAG: hypothetical protein US74_C0012G0032 [Parcubacteria group bacterium GW2011_GWA2_38_13]